MSPSGKPDGFTAYKFKSLQVYASEEWMANAAKKYRTVYDRSETTFISAELAFYNKLFDEEDWTARLCLKAYHHSGENKTLLCTLEKEEVIKADTNIVYFRQGWGNAEAGKYWTRGDYYWEAWINDVHVGTQAFHVEEVGRVTEGSNPYLDITSVKFFAGGYDLLPVTERKYMTAFKRDETPYIWAEVQFRNKTEKDYYYELFFNYYDNAGQPKASLPTRGFTQKNTAGTITTICEGWGSATPGSWQDDAYTLEIVFMDVLQTVVPFRVGKEFAEGVPQLLQSPSDENFAPGIKLVTEEPQESLEQLMQGLNALIGLGNIKKKISEHISYIEFLKIRREKGFEENITPGLHAVFTGNPGTGKTTVVKMLGKIYRSLGLLSKGHVTEADRSTLVAEFIGQTAPKVRKLIDAARGGILFIDEAYMLAREGDDNKDFGKEVIEVLLKEMSDGPGDIAIMAAGYPREMENFLNSNPGLKSRFDYYFHFEDYLPDELLAIAESACISRGVKFSPEARTLASGILTEAYRGRDTSFGNARFAISIVDEGKMNMGKRLMQSGNYSELTEEQLSLITADDLKHLLTAKEKRLPDLKIDEELLQEAMHELNSMTGMENVKQEVGEMIRLTRYYRETGKDVLNRFSLHSVFSGNPGTGKTTVARIIGKVYKALGLLERGHVTEADRERLVAGYVGQTALKTKEMIDKATGGVLFIDEAYALAEGGHGDFGREAIEVILKNMEDRRGELAVIAAGYPDNRQHFLESNPGLKSRFSKTYHFRDFTAEELFSIAMGMLATENITPDENAASHLKNCFESWVASKDKYFGNARSVRNLVDEAVKNQQLRMAEIPADVRTPRMMETLILQDVKEFSPDLPEEKRSLGFRFGDRQ